MPLYSADKYYYIAVALHFVTWPTHHKVNNYQGWRASGDSVMEITVIDGNQVGIESRVER